MLKSLFAAILLALTTVSATNSWYIVKASLSDYWNNEAELTYVTAYTHTDSAWKLGSEAGVHIEVSNGIWYLFNRKIIWHGTPEFCANRQLMQIEVRESNDKGKTWSKPTTIIENTPGTPWECAATDGDVYFNEAENTWHYLFQCLDRKGGWAGCHATLSGASPVGKYTSEGIINPVIKSGEIWSKICTSETARCRIISKNSPYGKILDEGTFDIIEYTDGYYYVSFHGYDGIHGFRGIAKSKDFDTWETIVNDSILDSSDTHTFTTKWDQNGSIGFGSSRTLFINGYYYTFAEAADKNLSCEKDQNWVISLFRSDTLTASQLNGFPGKNPIFTKDSFPTKDEFSLPCNPAYVGAFVDTDGTTYVHFSRSSNNPKLAGIYLYKLTKKFESYKTAEVFNQEL